MTVPECSCKRCLELMLHEFSPELIGDPITITRQTPGSRPEPGDRREAA